MSTSSTPSTQCSRPSYALSVTQPTPPRSPSRSVTSNLIAEFRHNATPTESPPFLSLPGVPHAALLADWDEVFHNFSSADYPPPSLYQSSSFESTKESSSSTEVLRNDEDEFIIAPRSGASTSYFNDVYQDRHSLYAPSLESIQPPILAAGESRSANSRRTQGHTRRKHDIDACPLPMSKPQMSDNLRTMLCKVEAIQAGLNGHPLLTTPYRRSQPTTPQRAAAVLSRPYLRDGRLAAGHRMGNSPLLTPAIQRVLATTPQKAPSTRSRRSMRSLLSLPGTPRTPTPSQLTVEEQFDISLRLPATDAEVRNLEALNRVVAIIEGHSAETAGGVPEDPHVGTARLVELRDLIRDLKRTAQEDDNILQRRGGSF